MSRTNTWDENTPDGAVDEGDEIDDFMRIGKVDLREIINQVAGVPEATPLADPAVPVDRNLGTLRSELTTAQGTIASQNFVQTRSWLGVLTTATGTIVQSPEYVQLSDASSGHVAVQIPIVYPIGTVVTKIGVRTLFNTTGASLVGTLRRYVDGTGTVVFTTGAISNSAAPQWNESAVGSHTILADNAYVFEIDITTPGTVGNPVRVYAIRINGTSSSAALRH